MKKFFNKKSVAIAAALVLAQSAFAQSFITNEATVNIYGNNDSSNNSKEGVFITSNGGSNGAIDNDQAYISLTTDGKLFLGSKGGGRRDQNLGMGLSALVEVGSNRVFIDGGGAEITVDESVSINTNTGITGTLDVTGATSIGGALSVQGLSTTTGINNTGALNQNGDTNIIGTTSINASGNANTTIGTLGGGSVNTLQGAANNITAVGANTISGGTNSLISTTGANTITSATGNAIIARTSNTLSAGTSNEITAVTSNTIIAATNNMTATAANNIQGPVNNIGTSGASANTIGNTLAGTTVTSRAGNATQALANGNARTSVTGAVSSLTGATVAPSSQVLLSNAGGTSVDANGKIVTGAEGASAALTLTNGLGNTHGLVVTESQTTLSGGTQSSSMTLTDRAATFSNAQTGAPITVTGVANGRADFDAVNVRQFAGAIAAVSAQANIPALAAGQDRNFGIGMGHFMGKSALAMGMSMRGSNNSVYKATLSSGLNAGTSQAVVGVGAAWGF